MTVEHGRLSTYTHRGCRCDECKAARADYDTRRRSTPEGRRKDRGKWQLYSRALYVLKARHLAEYQSIVAELRSEEVAP